MEKKTLQEMMSHVAEVELVYRSKVKASDRPLISSSSDVYDLLKELWEEEKMDLVERFKVFKQG